jgi:hypothetical protein
MPDCLVFSELLPIYFLVRNMCFVAGQVELYYYQLLMQSDRFRAVLNSWQCNAKQSGLMLQGNLMNRIYVTTILLN